MKFNIDRRELADALSILMDVVPTRAAQPVLMNIQCTGNDDGTVSFSASDLEVGIRCVLDVDALTDPESVLIPACKFNALIRDDWAKTISIDTSKGFSVTSENGKFRLLASTEDFPEIPELPEGAISISGLTDVARKTLFATSRDSTRYTMAGVFINIDKSGIDFVASDTHRLSCVRVNRGGDPASAIVVPKCLALLAKLGADSAFVFLTAHELIAVSGSTTVVARLIDGQFPRYKEVIPKNLDKCFSVDRDLFLRSIRLVRGTAHAETNAITIALRDGEVCLTSIGGEGSGEVVIPADVSGETVISVNCAYLIDAMKAIDCETVRIDCVDGDTPFGFSDGNFQHIIMPIRAKE